MWSVDPVWCVLCEERENKTEKNKNRRVGPSGSPSRQSPLYEVKVAQAVTFRYSAASARL